MLHRACLGSIERFIGILIEHYGGAFPAWLSPVQVNVLPVNNAYHLDYCKEVYNILRDKDIRVELDDSNDKLGYRMRNSQVKKYPFTLVIGDHERDDRTVTYRRFGSNEQITVGLEAFVELIQKEITDKKATE